MNFGKSIFNVREIFFPLFVWVFIFVIYWSFTWFFNEPINPVVYGIPLLFAICVYAGYLTSGYYNPYYNIIGIKKNRNYLILTLVGFSTVVLQFLVNIGNLGKNLSQIREEHQDNMQSGIQDTLYSFLFPLLIFAFIVVNFNNLKHKKAVNIFVLLSCFAFIPINGGRLNFLLFGTLYSSVYLFRNFHRLKKYYIKNLLKFLLIIFVMAILGSFYGILRTGKDNEQLVNYLSTIQHINNDTLFYLSGMPYNIGLVVIVFINTFYDYTGGTVYYLSIFIDEFHKIDYRTYGFYNFNFLDRLQIIDWLKTHDDIDKLYLNYDIKYNVWATFVRDFAIDFGIVGSFVVLILLTALMFHARKYLNQSHSAQVLFFLIFGFLLFSPFHSLFLVTRVYGITFFISLILFVRFKYINSNKIQRTNNNSYNL